MSETHLITIRDLIRFMLITHKALPKPHSVLKTIPSIESLNLLLHKWLSHSSVKFCYATFIIRRTTKLRPTQAYAKNPSHSDVHQKSVLLRRDLETRPTSNVIYIYACRQA